MVGRYLEIRVSEFRYRADVGKKDGRVRSGKVLERLYPLRLFHEVYDLSSQKRGGPATIREFNPAGGYIIRQWLAGTAWRDLASSVIT